MSHSLLTLCTLEPEFALYLFLLEFDPLIIILASTFVKLFMA